MNVLASPTSKKHLTDETRNQARHRKCVDSVFGSISEPVAVRNINSLGSVKGLILD